jgi:hypothetical protein
MSIPLKNSKNAFATILAIGMCVFVALFAWQGKVGLRQSPKNLREELLRETPLGTPLYEVKKVLNNKGLSFVLDTDKGFWKRDTDLVVGVKHIEVNLGTYTALFRGTFGWQTMYVTAYWGFNNKDQLVDIWIWKVGGL